VFRNVSNRAAYHLQAFAPVGLRRFLDTSSSSFDIAHIHACHNVLGIMASRALSRAGVPYVLSPNGTATVFERRLVAKRVLERLGGAEATGRASACWPSPNPKRASCISCVGPPVWRWCRTPSICASSSRARTVPGSDGRGLDGSPVCCSSVRSRPASGVATLVEAFDRLRIVRRAW
jgi:hypothetical protein